MTAFTVSTGQEGTDMFNLPARVSQEAALSTHVHFKRVAGDHESLQQQHARSVANQTVALHLAQTQASVSGAALGGLPGGAQRGEDPASPVRW